LLGSTLEGRAAKEEEKNNGLISFQPHQADEDI
jgi:hypothetical protein